jgi:dTMP kinase
MGTTGRLIVVCGIDGSGKTVQSRMLCERLTRSGRSAHYIEFPRYTGSFFGDLIARYLRGEFAPRPGDVNPYLAALPFACDRWEARPILEKWLERRDAVVCNRYVSANLAHQGSKIEAEEESERFCRWVQQMEYEVFGVPRPDLHVWLDVEPETAVGLLDGKGEREYLDGKEDIHEGDLEYLRATRTMYERLARRDAGWCTIRCAPDGELLDRDDVADRVWTEVRRILD